MGEEKNDTLQLQRQQQRQAEQFRQAEEEIKETGEFADVEEIQEETEFQQPEEVRENASVPVMEEPVQQREMSQKECRAAKRRDERAKRQADRKTRAENRRKEKEKKRKDKRKGSPHEDMAQAQQRQQEIYFAKVKIQADKAFADMKAKMQMKLTDKQKLRKPKLVKEIETYREWFELSAGTVPLTPEVDVFQQTVLAYIKDAEVGIPLFRQLCSLTLQTEEADLARQEAFFRSTFTASYLEAKGKPVPQVLGNYLAQIVSDHDDRIEKIRAVFNSMAETVLSHLTEEEQKEFAKNYGHLRKEGRTAYLKQVQALQQEYGGDLNAAKIRYAERFYAQPR